MRAKRFQLAVALLGLTCATVTGPELAMVATPSPIAGDYTYRNTVDIGGINEEALIESWKAFVKVAFSGTKRVTLRIDSFGGSIFLGNRFIREMEDLKKRKDLIVACIVDGSAYSMGAVLLESPVCDIRLATRRSTILFHNGSSGAKGTAEDLKQSAAFLEALNRAMSLMIAERIGMSVTIYREKIAHADWTMGVEEARDANVIDGFVSPELIEPPES